MPPPKPITPEDALARIAAALEALGDWPAGGLYANALETAALSLTALQTAVALKSTAKGPPQTPGTGTRHVFRFVLTDEELTGLRAAMRVCRTDLKEADFAQFLVREALHRKGFHP